MFPKISLYNDDQIITQNYPGMPSKDLPKTVTPNGKAGFPGLITPKTHTASQNFVTIPSVLCRKETSPSFAKGIAAEFSQMQTRGNEISLDVIKALGGHENDLKVNLNTWLEIKKETGLYQKFLAVISDKIMFYGFFIYF